MEEADTERYRFDGRIAKKINLKETVDNEIEKYNN